ncbi:PREDICTED: uncharacterized protein LOC106102514 isoform X2 [Papilio polytes]|uniref:uncharacterized protein LOC106102514 isoform X2 n=1 Tax=Papilio polytes TaxID=76194 RepID=UPI000676A291|nr:PREDICTED: uncharacterized protein LOC106102514 isoform X2 [Papilio polytes]XP_013137477.1 PREDICTED: uncharacterized protein LOC106102514 isoform X2 [Papilio polytes]XP_013137478.1 PREDICTED: uncharacterized protein LOC106102514 isoform X2 [Papilio polytes]
MSLPSKVNKENFRLLDLSSDEESEDLQLEIIPNRKKKITRKERNRTAPPKEPNVGAEVQCALKWAVRGTLLLWLLMLTWICAALYDQVSMMRLDIAKVSTSSDSVGDALQVCHSAAKELRANATSLHERLTRLEREHAELARRAQQTAVELASVADQLAAAPKLADTPRRLAELQRTVGDIGSQINSFDGALNSARKLALTATTGVEEVKTSLHQLELRSNETIANVSTNAKKDDDLKEQVATLNATLLSKVNSLETRIEEINKPVNTSVPVNVEPTSSSTSTTSSTTSTTTQAPGPPVKPPILRH